MTSPWNERRPARPRHLSALIALILAVTPGCSGLSQLTQSVDKFDSAVHSTSTAQMQFFLAVQTTDCVSQFYSRSLAWAQDQARTPDLTGACQPTILDDSQLKIRQALMDALTLYADKMSALAGASDNKTLDSNAQDLARQLNSLATSHGFTGLPVASGIEAAITAIAEMALDQRRFNDVKAAANAMQEHLTTVVEALKMENTNFAQGIDSKLGGVEGQLQQALVDAHPQRKAMSFFDVVRARELLTTINPLGSVPMSAPEGADPAAAITEKAASDLNLALDGITRANHAIATSGTGGLVAIVNDLVARAKAAQAAQSTLNK